MKGHTLKREAPFPASPRIKSARIDECDMPIQPSPAAVDGLFSRVTRIEYNNGRIELEDACVFVRY